MNKHVDDPSTPERSQTILDPTEILKASADMMPGVTWISAPDGTWTYCSPQWMELTGRDEALGQGWLQAVHPEDFQDLTLHYEQAHQRQEALSKACRIRRASGEYHWAILHARPRLTPNGSFPGCVGSVVEIPEIKEAELPLYAHHNRIRLITDALPALISYIDADLRYCFANRRYELWFGHSRDEIIGRTMIEVLGEAAVAALRPHIDAALRGEAVHFELETPYSDGGTRWIDAQYVPDKSPDGEVRGFYVLVLDVTERKQAEMALREADRRKDEFLAILAHELRNPLAPIRSGLEVLKLARNQPEVCDRVGNIMERHLQQMVTLVDDLLDVSRITFGKLELRLSRVRLDEVIHLAVEASQPLISARGHDLTIQMPEDPVYLDADIHRLTQIISNLLNNAANYTPEGGRIDLRGERRDGHIVIRVKDNGIGIAPEARTKIFEMFVQVDRSLEQTQSGLGMGLTLCKSLVEMHGGRIWVESPGLGKGSEFFISLPLDRDELGHATAGTAATGSSNSPHRQRVLVVDDNTDAAALLSMQIELLGHEVRTAADGQEAVDLAEEFRPTIVLLDLGMPRMDGYEAAKLIRRQPWGAEIVIVALTGWGQQSDRERTREAGFSAHLVKPLSQEMLLEVLRQ